MLETNVGDEDIAVLREVERLLNGYVLEVVCLFFIFKVNMYVFQVNIFTSKYFSSFYTFIFSYLPFDCCKEIPWPKKYKIKHLIWSPWFQKVLESMIIMEKSMVVGWQTGDTGVIAESLLITSM